MTTANIAIQIKKSGESGNTPVDLQHGEIAINYADGKLYYKNDANVIKYISNQDTFSTINSNGQLLLASSPTDILNVVAGNNVSISTNTISKSITINAQSSDSLYALDRINSAFDTANSSGVYANGSFAEANAAFQTANSAYTQAKIGRAHV